MEVALLGPLRVRDGATEVPVGAAKERAVLELLALAGGRVVAVDALVDGLWGDEPPATAVKTLRNYVARLRRALPTGSIESVDGGYALAVGPADVDLTRFEAALAGARAARAGGDEATAREHLAAGLALWRGAPLADLRGLAAGDREAARLDELHLGAEEDLAECRLALGEHAAAIADLEAMVRDAPLRERRWALLLLALYRAGRQADALRAYQRCRDTLVETLGIEPGDELRRLERAVIAQDPALDAPVPPSPSRLTEPGLPPTIAALAASPMVGRAAELAQVEAAWTEVAAGRPHAVVLVGEPGVGKTRLLGQLGTDAHERGALVLFGRCDPEPIVPYQPLVEGLRWFAHEADPATLADALGTDAAELARLVPEVARRLDVTPARATDGPTGRYRLFDAVTSVVERLAADRPVLLAIDDLHWADADTVALLRHLLRSIAGSRVLVAAASRGAAGRGDEGAGAPSTAPDLAALAPPEVAVDTIAIGGLDVDAVGELLDLDDERARAVSELTGGSPLFLREVRRHLDLTGRLALGDEPDGGALPDGLQRAVAHRLGALSGRARRFLGVAAVAGPTWELAVVAAAADTDDRDALDAADEAVSAHVLLDALDRPGALTFSHALVRAAILDGTSAARAAYLHGRLADALVARHGDDPDAIAAEVAHHLARAARPASDPAPSDWARRAGAVASTRSAWDAAASALEQAWRLRPPGDDGPRLDLLVELAEAQRAAGRADDARATFDEALDLARRAGDAEAFATTALTWASVPVDVQRELDDVIAVLDEAAERLPAGDGSLRASVLGRSAFSKAWRNDPDARSRSDDAIAMARRVGDREALARALGWSESTRSSFERCEPGGPWDELRSLAAEPGNAFERDHGGPATIDLDHMAAVAASIDAVHHGRRAEARAAVAVLRSRPSAALPDVALRIDLVEGALDVLDGDIARADARCAALLDLAGRRDLRNLWLLTSALLVDVRRWQGRLADLAPWFARRPPTGGPRLPKIGTIRLEVLAATGHDDDVDQALDEVAHGSRLDDLMPVERPFALVTLAGLAADRGHTDAASALVEPLAALPALIVHDEDAGSAGPVDLARGRVAGALGRHDDAATHLAAARELAAAYPAPGWLALCDVAEAELLVARGALAAEIEARLAAAGAVADELGLGRVHAAADRVRSRAR